MCVSFRHLPKSQIYFLIRAVIASVIGWRKVCGLLENCQLVNNEANTRSQLSPDCYSWPGTDRPPCDVNLHTKMSISTYPDLSVFHGSKTLLVKFGCMYPPWIFLKFRLEMRRYDMEETQAGRSIVANVKDSCVITVCSKRIQSA